MRRRMRAAALSFCLAFSMLVAPAGVLAEETKAESAAETEAMEMAETESAEVETMEMAETESAETEAMEMAETESAETEAMEMAESETAEAEVSLEGERAEPVMAPAVEELAPGDVVNGFEVLEIRDFPLVGGVIVYFEHQKTGAEFMYIANDDTNRTFDLTFFTRPTDNTGLPHVFEHATLGGSEKYPSKSLFFNLIYQVYQTYMNAATYDCMTTYPVASLSEEQLLKLADLYTDSCLHPMIMYDESIYREEAWRYRMADAEAPLTIEGTVYSEMLGAIDLEDAAYKNYCRTTFPGSVLGFEQGGDPADIPNMTWDSLKNYHNLFYHPSNCIGFLYGEIEDYGAFLALLDEAFAPYEKEEFTFEDSEYEPITEPVRAEIAFPVEAGANTTNASTIYYSFVCKDVPEEQIHILDTLTDVLAADASPYQQTMKKVLPSGQFSVFIELAGPEPAIVFSASHVNPEDADVFAETVDSILADVAEKGFDAEMVDSVMAQLAMSNRLVREAADVGVESVIPNLAYNYATTGDPWAYLDYVDTLNRMDELNGEGAYAEVVASFLSGSETTALTVTYPEPGLREQLNAAEAERLQEVKAGTSQEEIEAIVTASNAMETEEDNSAMVAQLQAVTVESLPEEVRLYDYTDEMGEDGVRRINVTAGVDGVGQVDLYLDAAGLPQEYLHLFKLYTDLTGYLDTNELTREEIANLSSRYLYGGGIVVDETGHVDDYHPWLHAAWIGTDEEMGEGYDLMYQLLFDLKLDDAQRVTEAVSAVKASLKASITQEPYAVQLYRSYGRFWPMYQYMSYVNYLEYYEFLEEIEDALAVDPDSVIAALQEVQSFFHNRNGAVMTFCGSEESQENNEVLADAFFAKLDDVEVEPAEYDLPVPENSEALVVESSVQYNGVVASYDALNLPGFSGQLDAVTGLVLDTFLMPLLRDQYGAYGVFHSAGFESGVYLISYRDPNVEETFEVYESLPELVEELEIDQETLDGYILSSYTYYAQSTGELSGAVAAAKKVLEGKSQEDVLQYMRDLKAVTPETVKEYADMYVQMLANGARFTSGGAAAISENEYLYDAVLNPFSAVDPTSVAFTDVVEGDEDYEAIRFAFENGLMQPLAEDLFGKAEDATVGDLAVAIYGFAIGEGADPESAVEELSMYGIVAEGADPSAVLTGEETAATIQNLNAALGLPADFYVPEGLPETMTRSDVAVMFLDYYTALSE